MEVSFLDENPLIKEEYFPQTKGFQCQSCSKVLKSRKAWKDHMRIHTGEKPQICPVEGCNKSFIQYSSLQKHLRAHKGEKPYKCSTCGKNFSQICNLKRHERLHNGERPFVCEQCNKSFTTSSNLKQHMDTHNQTSHRCDFCGKDYQNARSFKKHMKTHHADKMSEIMMKEEAISTNGETLNGKRPAPSEFTYEVKKLVKKSVPVEIKDPEKIPNMSEEETKIEEEEEEMQTSSVGTSISSLQMGKSSTGFNPSECLMIRHKDHKDYLYKGKLMHQKENGEWEEHELEASEQNPSVCKPLKEISHFPNYSALEAKYDSLIETTKGYITHDLLNRSCNVLMCGGCNNVNAGETNNKSSGGGCGCSGQPKSQEKSCCSKKSSSEMEIEPVPEEVQKKSSCCSSKKEVSPPTASKSGCCSKEPKKSSCCSSKSEPVEKSSGGCCSVKTEETNKGENTSTSENVSKKSGCCCSGGAKEEKSEGASASGSGCCSDKPVAGSAQGGCCSGGCPCGDSSKLVLEPKDLTECAKFGSRQFTGCLCSETMSLKHTHGENCGHLMIYHDGHIDYIVGNQLHHVHDGHCDDHGIIEIIQEKNEHPANYDDLEL